MCVFKLLFGLPCPGCGLTRANLLFFTGNFYEAFLMHPLFLLADAFLLYLIWFFLIKRKKATKPFWILCLSVIAVYLIVFAVRVFLLWGKCEPFIFDPNALLPRLFSQAVPR